MLSPPHHSVSKCNRNQSTAQFFSLCDETQPKEERTVARTNYKFHKRQKELDRKRKKEEKRQSKLDAKKNKSEENSGTPSIEEDLE